MKNIDDGELVRLFKAAADNARAEAKAAGASIVYEENGKMIRKYADGRKTQVIYDEHGQRSEIELFIGDQNE